MSRTVPSKQISIRTAVSLLVAGQAGQGKHPAVTECVRFLPLKAK